MRKAILAAFTLSSSLALATPADTYGALSRGVSTAGTLTAAGDDASATYYNPAGLGLAAASGKSSLSLGYSVGMPMLSVERNANASGAQRYPTQEPGHQDWATLGGVFPLGGKLQNKVALGILIYLPTDKVVRVQSLDPRYPQWLRYQSGTDRLELDVGFGARLGKYFSIGAGLNVFAGLWGVVDFDIDLFERRVQRRDLTFDLITRTAATAGLTFTPLEKLRVAFSYRGENRLQVSQPNVIGMGDVGTLSLVVEGTVHFTPQQFALGVAYDPMPNLKLSADLKLQRWSKAPYPAMLVKVSMEGEVPEGLGLDEMFTFETNDPPTGFTDIVVPSVSAEYAFGNDIVVRGGYAFRPSYVPDQRGRSNFLDTNTHLVGLGTTLQFTDPIGIFTQPLKFDLGLQGQVLQTRLADKGEGDAVGDVTFGGLAFAGSAALRYEF